MDEHETIERIDDAPADTQLDDGEILTRENKPATHEPVQTEPTPVGKPPLPRTMINPRRRRAQASAAAWGR